MSAPAIEVIAGATGSVQNSAGLALGKIGTVAVGAQLLVRIPVSEKTARVRAFVQCDKAHSLQWYIAPSVIDAATLTLADATAVDDGDTFILNGLTFTAETTDGDASAAARKWYHPNQADGAVNLAALLSHATYGVPGLTASAAAVDATDVITLAPASVQPFTVLQFAQGTSAANEIAFASTTLSLLRPVEEAVSRAAITTTKGKSFEFWNDGHVPYLGITNNDGAAAATVIVEAARFAA